MIRNKIGNRTDKDRTVVHTLCPGEIHTELPGQLMQSSFVEMTNLFSFLLDLNVELEQGLNVVGRESDRNQTNVLVASLGQACNRVGSLGSLPCFGSDL
jgi:hypothetical protein